MDVDPGYKYIEKFRGGFNGIWSLKTLFQIIVLKLRKIGDFVSFKGQSITIINQTSLNRFHSNKVPRL